MDDGTTKKNHKPLAICLFFVAFQIYLIYLAVSKWLEA